MTPEEAEALLKNEWSPIYIKALADHLRWESRSSNSICTIDRRDAEILRAGLAALLRLEDLK